MTYGINDFEGSDLAEQLSAVEDRRSLNRSAGDLASYFAGAGAQFEVSRTFDPSDGANMQGGVANLAAVKGTTREVKFGGMSYEEAMNYSPSPLADKIGSYRDLKQVGLGDAPMIGGDPNSKGPKPTPWGMYAAIGVAGFLAYRGVKDMITPKRGRRY